MFLETERLVLRRFREEDFGDFFEYAADREMSRMMGRDDLTDRDAARTNFDWLKDREERSYALVLKENGKVIGNLNVGRVPDFPDEMDSEVLREKRGVSLSFSLSRHYQRRGLMYEALKAVIDELFQTEGVDYIHCGYFDFNAPSAALQKKLGFVRLATGTIHQNGEEIRTVENVLWRRRASGA